MKPVELKQETQEKPVYSGLQAAERSLETAKKEQAKYQDAKSTLLTAQNIRKSEIRRLRSELKAKAVEAAVNGKFDAYVQEFQEGCARLSVIDVELERLGIAERAIEFEKTPADRNVERCMSDVARLERCKNSYETAKREYGDLYREATAFEATREKFSASGVPRGNRLLVVKRELDRLAAFLGCEGDLASFIRDLEAGARG